MAKGFYSSERYCLSTGFVLVESMGGDLQNEWCVYDLKKEREYTIIIYHDGPVFISSTEYPGDYDAPGSYSTNYDILPKKWASMGIG